MKNFLDFILLAVVTVGICLFMSGCVNKQLAESYSQYLDTAGTEYLQYVENDPALTDDDKAIRHGNHDQAAATVKKFRETKWSW